MLESTWRNQTRDGPPHMVSASIAVLCSRSWESFAGCPTWQSRGIGVQGFYCCIESVASPRLASPRASFVLIACIDSPISSNAPQEEHHHENKQHLARCTVVGLEVWHVKTATHWRSVGDAEQWEQAGLDVGDAPWFELSGGRARSEMLSEPCHARDGGGTIATMRGDAKRLTATEEPEGGPQTTKASAKRTSPPCREGKVLLVRPTIPCPPPFSPRSRTLGAFHPSFGA